MTLFEVVAFIVSIAALGVAWSAIRQSAALGEKLSRLQGTLYETRADLREAREQLDARLSSLDIAIKRSSGQLRFDPSMRLSELYQLEPRAQTLLAGFHIGGCAHCAVDEDETLGEAVQRNGRNLDQVLAALHNLPSDGRMPDVRVPNVKFEN